MSKPLAVAAAFVVLAFGVAASKSSSLSQPGLIYVTAKTVLDRDGTQGSWISDKHGKRIGWAIVVCRDLGSGGPLGSASAMCVATYLFPRGRIQAAGTRKVRSSYTLSVTGGTGLYSNVGGQLLVQTVADNPRTEKLLFSLEP